MGANLGGSGLGEVWSGNCSVERGHMPPTPSMDRTVHSGSASVIALMVWPTQSVPARVERANWNGAHTASTAFPNWRASVLATNLRKAVPVAIPRTPPSSFWSAVMEAAMNALVMACGASALAKSSAARCNKWIVSASSRQTLSISQVHPPGPEELPAGSTNQTLREHVRIQIHGPWTARQHFWRNHSHTLLGTSSLQLGEGVQIFGCQTCSCQLHSGPGHLSLFHSIACCLASPSLFIVNPCRTSTMEEQCNCGTRPRVRATALWKTYLPFR